MAGVILLASTPFCILSRFKQGSFVNSFNPKCELSPRIEGPLASWECQGSDRQHFRGEGNVRSRGHTQCEQRDRWKWDRRQQDHTI